VLIGCGRSARFGWSVLYRRTKLEERARWLLKGSRRTPSRENHRVEGMANDRVGLLNQ
jgi:hypothetical protein